MNFVNNLLKCDIILESENDVFIDASAFEEEDLDLWLENYLYPLMGKHEARWLKELKFKTSEDIYEILKKDGCWLAIVLMKSALRYAHKLPDEKMYYINDNGNLHMDIPKKMLL